MCDTCKNFGLHVWEDDPSPAGVSLSPGKMLEYEACDDCIGHGRCPRCDRDNADVWPDPLQVDGASGEEYEKFPCPGCGWNFEEAFEECLANLY